MRWVFSVFYFKQVKNQLMCARLGRRSHMFQLVLQVAIACLAQCVLLTNLTAVVVVAADADDVPDVDADADVDANADESVWRRLMTMGEPTVPL